MTTQAQNQSLGEFSRRGFTLEQRVTQLEIDLTILKAQLDKE